MKLNKLLAATAFSLCFGFAAPVSAVVVQVQYTGKVSSGYDTTGVFGAAGSYLAGLAYTANYTFETNNGNAYSSSIENRVYGGDFFGILSPALSATYTINGTTVSMSGNWFGDISGYNDGLYSEISHDARDYAGTGLKYQYGYQYIYNDSNTLPASITDPFSYAVTADDFAGGYLEIHDYDYGSGVLDNAYAYLTPDHVTIGAPIPEPETYAMLLAGLSLLGFAACRRKLKQATAV